MSQPVDVERAGPDRWRDVRDLRRAALDAAPWAFAPAPPAERDDPEDYWRSRLQTSAATTMLATRGGSDTPVGLVVVGDSFDRPDAAGLYGLWVEPTDRGQGVGDAMVDAAIEIASAAGYAHLLLDVGESNEPAMRLYARHGFVPTGRTFVPTPPRDHVLEQEWVLSLGRSHPGAGGGS